MYKDASIWVAELNKLPSRQAGHVTSMFHSIRQHLNLPCVTGSKAFEGAEDYKASDLLHMLVYCIKLGSVCAQPR